MRKSSLGNHILRFFCYGVLLGIALCLISTAEAVDNSKQTALSNLREQMSKDGFYQYKIRKVRIKSGALDANGLFTDLKGQENKLRPYLRKADGTHQRKIEKITAGAFTRLWKLSDPYKGGKKAPADLKRKIYKSIIHYGQMEAARPDGWFRFHPSCFAIPTAAINIYFCFFDDMKGVESGKIKDSLTVNAHKWLRKMGMQAWTQPKRSDSTDFNVVQINRFRKHVWWVGGNGLSYRPAFQAAIMMNSVKMVDVMAEVSRRAMSNVSQNTYDKAFWTEGFTADGAGWGHGKQCLIWGYPVHGTKAALAILEQLKGTPWAQTLGRNNVEAMLNYLRGSSWYYYRGFTPPVLSRMNMVYSPVKKDHVPCFSMAKGFAKSWNNSLTAAEQSELKQYVTEAGKNSFIMKGQPAGRYTGTRYFWNNDNLIKKTADYYIFVAMASRRCDGIESTSSPASKYNFFTCDGLTLFEHTGDEYRQAIGAWNMTAFPGVTARQGEDKLKPITNWSGYKSKHNFAAGATSGGQNAVCGFIFEKDTKNKNAKKANPFIFGIKAYKSYFMFGDIFLALGTGITDVSGKYNEPVWTTIDQTLKRGVSGNLKKAGSKGDQVLWTENNGFAYGVLTEHTKGKIKAKTERRATKWDKLANSNKKKHGKSTNCDIFQMWIDHGSKPRNASYAYLVYSGKENPAKVFARPQVKILSNTEDLQAASDASGKVIGAVFYNKAAVLNAGSWKIKVTAPCAVLVEQKGDKLQVSVTDAAMNKNLKVINVLVTRKVSGKNVKQYKNFSAIAVPMPEGELCGKPVTVEVSLNQ
jgi:hypothetical protein